MKKTNRIVLSLIAALAGALPLTQGCAGDSKPSDAQPTGTAAAAVTNVPPGVGCVVISAVGAWNTSTSVDVMPGQNVTVDFPVPSGTVAFSAVAYATACAQVTPASIPNWVSASVVTTVQAGQVTPLDLDLQQSGSGSITVGFTPPPACTAIAKPCLQPAECCSGYCAPNNTCQQSPGGCPMGLSQCGPSCVDTANDPANCGACGLHCPPGAACSAGICLPPFCPPGLTQCGPICVDAANDPANCGACGLHCAPGAACSAGVCLPPFCPPGLTQCGPICVNAASDSANCGACGNQCMPGATCSAGVCTGGGQCVTPADCPPSASECAAPTCNGGVCGINFLAQGTLVGMQTPGDCRANACDGAGSVIAIIDDTDIPPDDGNSCTFEICAGGVPAHPPAPNGTACLGGVCLGGACTTSCADGLRDGQETDVDCGGGVCAPCAVSKQCLLDSDCTSNACDAIALICVSNQCVDHRLDGQESDVDCGGPTCAPCAVGQHCNASFDCQAGHICNAAHLCQ